MSRTVATVAAIRTGGVQAHNWHGRDAVSAAVKQDRIGPVALGELGFEGDEQADRVNHGGPDKAVLVYAGANYPRWASEQGLDFPEGAFFENITLHDADAADPLDETTVHLGETWRLGTAVVQVSQPRNPCWKLASRWGVADLVVRVQQTRWSGWYLRVLEPGEVSPGDRVELLDRPMLAPTIAEIARVMNVDKHDLDGARRLLAAEGLPQRWRDKLEVRLGGTIEDDSARILGTWG